MRSTTYAGALALAGTAWIGAHGCGAQMKEAGMPAAVERAPGAFEGAPEAPSPLVAMAEDGVKLDRPGAARAADAAELNARRDGEWHVVREFAVATYDPADDGPRRDFRETIFWSPAVRTGADGRATIAFPTSDAVTSFRITAEGLAAGVPGHAEATIASRLPLALAANLPVEVTTGDRIALPVTITNNTGAAVDASITATLGASITVATLGPTDRSLRIPARAARTVTYQLAVTGLDGANGAGDLELAVTAGANRDALRRSLKIVPNGFPAAKSFAGALADKPARHTLRLPDTAVAGSAHTTIKLYPTPVASMVTAVDSIVREPSGCFEQASSSNYPNVMVLSYLQTAGGAQSPDVAAEATAKLDRGYALLTGYESKSKGFEWFGGDPGHEALSAYGLLQFREMAKVYPGMDPTLVDRTAAWLRSRRDGKGGYQRNARALDSFGAASPAVTDAYITYALAESGENDLAAELAIARKHAAAATDPYILALSVGALLAANKTDADGTAGLARLAKLQGKDGAFAGADHSITRSGGQALQIETTALAALAMMKSEAAYRREIAAALDWLTRQRSQWGGYGSTQSTILSLKALTVQAAHAKQPPPGATVAVWVNGERIAAAALDDGEGAIELPDVGKHLRPGDNLIELRAGKGVQVEYSMGATWYDRSPATSPAATVAVSASLDRKRVRVGRGVTLTATVKNTTAKGQPMTMARVGLPGGLKFQPWQLDELVAKGQVDFIETREREVILYFRQMKPNETRSVPVQLLAQVPGRYVGPPSSAYLYYTDEHRQYDAPLAIDVLKPPPIRKKPVAPAPTAGTK
jgi:uncharacterized protein YfaS (alpha-2-macroglobulin family)